MRFYRLTNTAGAYFGEVNGFVIRARSNAAARLLASKNARDEGGALWLDPLRSSCVALSITGDAQILCTNTRWS